MQNRTGFDPHDRNHATVVHPSSKNSEPAAPGTEATSSKTSRGFESGAAGLSVA